MRLGDLIQVRYMDQVEYLGMGMEEPVIHWTPPYLGILYETPDMCKDCVWRMWCFAREAGHILSPQKDRIEVISEANTGY